MRERTLARPSPAARLCAVLTHYARTRARADSRHRIMVQHSDSRGPPALLTNRPSVRELDPLLLREGTSRNGWQPTADALLTMRSKRQQVPAGGNGLAVVQAIFRPSASRTFATGCAPLFHNCSIPIGPKQAV